MTADGYTYVLDVVFAVITQDLILGKPWLFEHNLRINWIYHSISFAQETCLPESATLNSVTLSPRAVLMSSKSFAGMITKNRSPCYFLMINLPRSADDECMECANTDILPLSRPQTLPSPRPVEHWIELISNFKLFSRSPYRLSRHETEKMQVVVEGLLG
jgi:hypothetical protein